MANRVRTDFVGQNLKEGDIVISALNNQLYFGVMVCQVESGGINVEFHGGGIEKPFVHTIIYPESECYAIGNLMIPASIGETLLPRVKELRGL
jgi:hypothetical protein